jgi:protein-disulfide isomerase
MRVSGSSVCGVLLLLLPACQSTPRGTATPSQGSPPTAAEVRAIEQRIVGYYETTATVPPGVTLTLRDVEPAPVPGLLKAVLEVSRGSQKQEVPLLVSRDAHYFLAGNFIDLTVDPLKAVTDKIALANQPIRGDPAAKVTVVEYADFQCPFCARAYRMMEDSLLKDYGNRVRFVFKHLPLQTHHWAQKAAAASECARQQRPEAFWAVYHFLFQNQSAITPENLMEKLQPVIREAGVAPDAFADCMKDQGGLPAVQADMAEARALKVRSTPTFFINGRRLEGALPYDHFQRVVNEALGITKTSVPTASMSSDQLAPSSPGPRG